MPKLLMVNTVCSGSHGRIMRDLRAGAEADGCEVMMAYGRGDAPDGSALRIGTQTDVLLHVAQTRLLDRHARGSRAATRAFVRALEAYQPDLLHIHNVHGYYLHAETLFDWIRVHGLPTVWTLHDCWALTGHCSHFVRAACERWKAGCYDCPLKHAYPASYGLDASRANWRWRRAAFATVPSLRIVSPSRWLDGVLMESTLCDVPRQVIPNGVDLSLFQPDDTGGHEAVRARYGIPDDRPMLLAVASPFDDRKGFADALALSRILEDRAHIVLVGLTAKQTDGLPENVTGIERTDGPEALVSLYAAADCLINPTYEDTYPTVNMEAMACGTPVASYAVGGATEQLQVPMGRPVPVGDPKALAHVALALAQEKAQLRTQCRAYAAGHFDRRQAIRAYLSLYQSMMGVTER